MKKTIILVAMLASALALGCADTKKREEEIALRVNATVAAIPTQTPYPTSTPALVSTPEPTPYPDQPATRSRRATITDDRPSAETDPYITNINPSPYEYKPALAYDGPAGIPSAALAPPPASPTSPSSPWEWRPTRTPPPKPGPRPPML